MMKLKVLILLSLPLISFSQVTEQLLHSQWQFKNVKDEQWLPATVPGTVHTDLYKNKKIPDPFFADYEKSLQWIEKEDWEYKTIIILNSSDLSYEHINLVFDGIDTYAEIFVNGNKMLSANNMFRQWEVDAKKSLKVGSNTIRLLFSSAVNKANSEAKKLNYKLPGDEKVFTRKAQFQYGWDFGPRFVTCGIWKEVKLVKWNRLKIENCQYVQKLLNDTIADLEFVCNIKSTVEGDFILKLNKEESVKNSILKQLKVHITKGENKISVGNKISKPKLWWSNGQGAPNLYHFSLSVHDNLKLIDSKKIRIGLRTIELVREKDKTGESFYFKLNNIPVFMKGANVIPPDIFTPNITKQKYSELLNNAIDANMNMLRVWGGGVYADDEFYDLCDKKGILVWQDFMFACAMYPGDKEFADNVNEEVKQQLIRLRNHPCIALWCGNNEVDEGWKNWGWQKQYKISPVDSGTIWNDYVSMFQYQIPQLINEYDPQRTGSYISTSPMIGWGHKESLQSGDAHYWGVWWGNEPFSAYKTKVGRFMSEYGFQSLPAASSIKKFTGDSVLNISSEALRNHQKHPTGFENIQSFIFNEYGPVTDFSSYAYLSQLVQADGMKTAIEAHRRAKPYCMGSVYWQLNDCWPAISWSGIDYYGNRKALHYAAKHTFSDILISIDENENTYPVHIISDKLKDIIGKLDIRICDLNGKVLWWESSSTTKVAANSSRVYYMLDKAVVNKYNKNGMVLMCSFKTEAGQEITAPLFFFIAAKELVLSKPNITVNKISEKRFSLKTDVLAKNIYIHLDNSEIKLSDNFFDLLPGKEKIIEIQDESNFSAIEKQLRFTTLFDVRGK